VSQKKKELIIKAELGESAVDQEGKATTSSFPSSPAGHYGYIHLQINVENFQETMRRNTTMRIIAALSVFAIGIVISTFCPYGTQGPSTTSSRQPARWRPAISTRICPLTQRRDRDLTRSFNDMIQKLREQRRLEERLREAEHLSAVGQLARGIATRSATR